MYILYFVICFAASVMGAICGIGGGVIIKPVLDATGTMDVALINFLSGCTVLSMSTYSVIKSKCSGNSKIEFRKGIPLAVGAALGGIVGKRLFAYIKECSSDPDNVGMVQSACLLVITLGTLLYTLYKEL